MSDGVMPCRLDWLRMDGNDGTRDANGIQWILTKCEGFWDSPVPRVTLTERVFYDGAYMAPNFMKERIIKIEGRAFADTQYFPNEKAAWLALRTAQARVNGMCSEPNTVYPLTFESEIGNITSYVQLDDSTSTQPFAVFTPAFEFSLQLIAADPRKYSENWHVVSGRLPLQPSNSGVDFDGAGAGHGIDFDGAGPGHGIRFGDDIVTGGARCLNYGSAPSVPVFTVYGPLVNPNLSTQDAAGNGYNMKYNATLADGEFVVIDPADPSVLLGGTATRRTKLNPANWSGFKVPPATDVPGELVVGLEHEGAIDATGYFEASYRDCWW